MMTLTIAMTLVVSTPLYSIEELPPLKHVESVQLLDDGSVFTSSEGFGTIMRSDRTTQEVMVPPNLVPGQLLGRFTEMDKAGRVFGYVQQKSGETTEFVLDSAGYRLLSDPTNSGEFPHRIRCWYRKVSPNSVRATWQRNSKPELLPMPDGWSDPSLVDQYNEDPESKAVTNKGDRIAGWIRWSTPRWPRFMPVLWTIRGDSVEATVLPTPPNTVHAMVTGMNSNGTIVGKFSEVGARYQLAAPSSWSPVWRACKWEAGDFRPLPSPEGLQDREMESWESAADIVFDSGLIVGHITFTVADAPWKEPITELVLWTETGMTFVKDLPLNTTDFELKGVLAGNSRGELLCSALKLGGEPNKIYYVLLKPSPRKSSR